MLSVGTQLRNGAGVQRDQSRATELRRTNGDHCDIKINVACQQTHGFTTSQTRNRQQTQEALPWASNKSRVNRIDTAKYFPLIPPVHAHTFCNTCTEASEYFRARGARVFFPTRRGFLAAVSCRLALALLQPVIAHTSSSRRPLSRFNAPANARANFRVISCFAVIDSPFPMHRS